MKLKYFKIDSIENVKKQYHKLAFKYHSDINNTNDDIMKQINIEYEYAIKLAYSKHNKENKTKFEFNSEFEKHFITIINKIVTINDLNIKIVGSWLWVGGNTYPIKNQLKQLKFKWSSNRKMWYYAPNNNNKRYGKGYRSNFKKFSDIENYYGSKQIKKETTKQLD